MEGIVVGDGQLVAALAVDLAPGRLVAVAQRLPRGFVPVPRLVDRELSPGCEVGRVGGVGYDLGGVRVIVGLEREGVEDRWVYVARPADCLEGLNEALLAGDLAGLAGNVGLREDDRGRRGDILGIDLGPDVR